MKKFATYVTILFFSTSLLSGCCKNNSTNEDATNTQTSSYSSTQHSHDEEIETSSSETDPNTDTVIISEEQFTERDYRSSYDETECIRITLNGSSATASSDTVKISDSTITLTEDTTYIISGTLDNGSIIVDAPEDAKLQLVLENASINCDTSCSILILEADKVFITLAKDSENYLSNGGSFIATDDTNIDGVIFSKQDLTLNGSGSLTISSPSGHGIVCKDDLVVTEGSYYINATSHGLDANDSIRITSASIDIDSGKDGFHVENSDEAGLGYIYILDGTINITAADDGIHAEETLIIKGGNINIPECYEGLEALDISIEGGDISIIASDDGINAAGGLDQSGMGSDDIFGNNFGGGDMHGGGHGGPGGHGGGGAMPGGGMSSNSNGSISISGGNIYIYASGDGVDANGTVEMSGGYVEIVGPTYGDTATLDFDTTATITGGTFIGVGASNMAQSFSDTEQGVIAVSVGTQKAETKITLTDASGKSILSYIPREDYQVVILSSPDIIIGESYTLSIGSVSETFEAY